MNADDIANAIGQHLEAMAGVPQIVFEEQDKPSGLITPYLFFQYVPTIEKDDTIDGSSPESEGFATITVVDKPGNFGKAARAIGFDIKDHFYYPLTLPAGGGVVTIRKPAFVPRGFGDGVHFRVPVKIDIIAS